MSGRRGPVPVYQQIADELVRRIELGEIVPDRRMPSEAELVAEFGVARTTVRRSVALLVAQRYIFTVPHRGSWVVKRGVPG